jgi:hypothetical protein
VRADPRHVLLAVGGVHAQEQAVVAAAVGGDVVHDAALLVAEQRVADLVGLHVRDAAREQAVAAREGRAAGELEASHVRDVEEPGRLAHGGVLLEDAGVVDREGETGEVHHPRSPPHVGGVERGLPRLAHAPLRCS